MKNNKKHYYFIGICGVSMSGIAQFLANQGNKVSGSDLKKCQISPVRQAQGKNVKCQIFSGHKAENITKDIDMVVRTSAITPDSPGWVEVQGAQKLKIPVIKRSELIGKLLHNTVSIGVTGMHGKSTTSAMIATILVEAKLTPSFLIGAEVKNLGSSWKIGKLATPPLDKKTGKPIYLPHNTLFKGKTQYFVVEACEHDRSFLDMKPKIGVITNIDKEHLDYYKGGLPEIKQAFKKFIRNLPADGLLIINQDDSNLMSLIKAAKCKVKRVTIKKVWPGLKLKIPGAHNILNATLAARIAHELGIDSKIIQHSLNNFIGASRRFEIKGEKNGAIVIDDYGHHPTEIKTVIQAATEYLEKMSKSKCQISNQCQNPKSKFQTNRQSPIANRLIMVFQPHQYARTKILFNDFTKCFKGVDELIITDVFLIPGREKKVTENLAQKLAEEVAKNDINTKYISGYDNIIKYLRDNCQPGDIIITQGATDVHKVGEQLLK